MRLVRLQNVHTATTEMGALDVVLALERKEKRWKARAYCSVLRAFHARDLGTRDLVLARVKVIPSFMTSAMFTPRSVSRNDFFFFCGVFLPRVAFCLLAPFN